MIQIDTSDLFEKIICLTGAAIICSFMIPITTVANEDDWVEKNLLSMSKDFDYESSDTSRIELSASNLCEGNVDTIKNEQLRQDTSDKNSLLVRNLGKLTLTISNVYKKGDTAYIRDSVYYGLNSAITTMRKSEINIKDTNVFTDALGACAVFSTGNEALSTIEGGKLNTKKDYSNGISASFEGKVKAFNTKISTKGKHSESICAAGLVELKGVQAKSNNSKIAIVKEDGSLDVTSSSLFGNDKKCSIEMFRNKSDRMSRLNVIDSKLENKKKAKTFFYVHNTDAEAFLVNSVLKGNSSSLFEIRKANIKLTAMNQEIKGDIRIDKKSYLEMMILNKSKFKGSISNPCVSVSIDKSSKWELTKDAYISNLDDKKTNFSNIITNGHNIYYDQNNTANSWLSGKTIKLSDGGKIIPLNKKLNK